MIDEISFSAAEAELDATFAEEIEESILLGERVGRDILEKGPFRHFLAERYAIAQSAVRELIGIDASNQARISALQADIRFWQECCDWARSALVNAQEAEDQIRDHDREDFAAMTGEQEDPDDL